MKYRNLITIGMFIGFSSYLFFVSKASSYLSDDPKTCVNCHIMAPQYATWNHSSHKNIACNNCHVPQENIINKYYFKAKDGIRHAAMFTLELEPQVIKIGAKGKEVVQDNCLRCHQRVREITKSLNVSYQEASHGKGKYCWECHVEVPHGRVNSLSSVKNTRGHFKDNEKENIIPNWLKKELNNYKIK